MNIDEDYLCRLNTKYEHWVNDIYDGEVLLVDKGYGGFRGESRRVGEDLPADRPVA